MSQNTKLLTDFAPLFLFFVLFKTHGLLPATAALVVTTMLALSYSYYKERRVSVMPLVSGAIIALMGGLTLWFDNEDFIKMKPTVVCSFFAVILLVGAALKKGIVKTIFGSTMQLTDAGWRIFSVRWGLFFLLTAVLNEMVWRNYPTETWVNFKVFGLTSMTVLFTLLQMPLIKRHWIEDEPAAK